MNWFVTEAQFCYGYGRSFKLMKAKDVLCGLTGITLALLLPMLVSTGEGEVLAQWNFNSVPPDATLATGTNIVSTGSGTASLIGGTTATYATGSATDPDSAGNDNSGWNTASYAPQGTNNKTSGVQFNVSTLGYERIVITWDHRNSPTSSRYVRLQYSTNGRDRKSVV